MSESKTIAAISTPPGAGAVGMVRLSGPGALEIAGRVFRSVSGRDLRALRGYCGALGRIYDTAGWPVDDAVAFVYRAPKSYTGEDVVELCCHGGAFATRRLLYLCLEQGADPAQPGEFTKRAFLNGKLSLTQAEAVMDLVGAQGEASMRAALAARDGALTRAVDAVSERLLACSAHLAAWLDYPEEDLEPVDETDLAATLRGAEAEMDRLLATYRRGRVLREGIRTAIVGKPNVGKSTLMNLLSGYERSIVTDIPGTTRDVVQDTVDLGGCMLHLMDTAGLRDTEDVVERLGVDRTLDQIRTADLVLAVFDSSEPLDEADRLLLDSLQCRHCIAVVNKIDLPARLDIGEIERRIGQVAVLSARSGEGRQDLEELVVRTLELGNLDPTAALVANERQRHCLQEALDAVREAAGALARGVTLDAVGVCIDSALDSLLSLTGRRAAEAVVDEVFARFCVGK